MAARNGMTNRKPAPAIRLVADSAPGPAESGVSVDLPDGVRHFSIYDPLAAFQFRDELEFMTERAVEANPFVTPSFLVPAMPRLDERTLRLLVVRDENEVRSRLRFMMPFSVERTGLLLGGPRCVRAWTHPFGPRGTLPLDHDDPAGMLSSVLDAMGAGGLDLPPLLLVPDLWLEGPVARLLAAEIDRRGLPHRIANARERAAFDARAGAQGGQGLLSPRRRREARRLTRLLTREGPVRLACASAPEDVRPALEVFLSLEASGWKGRARTAMLDDRYRAAFAREAVNACAEKGRVRLYTLHAGATPVASLVVLVTGGQAVLWKMGYDERFAKASPGFLLMLRASEAMAADPAIDFVDSCAASGHSLMNRVWRERIAIGTMVIGLGPEHGRRVERAAAALDSTHRLQHSAWRLRRRLRQWFGR